ncbi:MAG: aminotransferase class V-fold PLP-dependent enzyme, partial [candidate division Zixibacteria bacterium]|nr:aminotransferase class V-fold PLP-dependent enzyme [candidate division Zixibacteria bacterium]
MKIPFLDLKSQYDSIKSDINRAISQVIESSSFVLGPSVAEFEENFSRYCHCQYTVAVNSGTSALFLTMKALGIGQGDEVITAANTFIATAAAIIHIGATPVLVDIDPLTRNIDINQIESAITTKTKAIIPVHLYGCMVDMERINAIAKKSKLIVIEDACQAHGAKFKNGPAGS